MFEPTVGLAALFASARAETDPPEALAHWVYPCALCGTVDVADAVGLCESCTTVRVRKPNRTRATAKKTAKKAARTSGGGR